MGFYAAAEVLARELLNPRFLNFPLIWGRGVLWSLFLSSLWWPRAKAAGVQTLRKGCSLPAPARGTSWAGRGRLAVVRRSVLSSFCSLNWETPAVGQVWKRKGAASFAELSGRRGVGRGGASVPREDRPRRPPPQGSPGGHRLAGGGGRGPRRLLFLRRRRLGAWRGCHFVARPPFRGAGGRGARRRCRRGVGAGLTTAPGQPPPPATKARASPLFLASGLGLHRPGAALRARGVCAFPESLLPSVPFQSGARHPYPRSGKGVRFIWPWPGRHRGKL